MHYPGSLNPLCFHALHHCTVKPPTLLQYKYVLLTNHLDQNKIVSQNKWYRDPEPNPRSLPPNDDYEGALPLHYDALKHGEYLHAITPLVNNIKSQFDIIKL